MRGREPLLEVRDLRVAFGRADGGTAATLDGVSFRVNRGETLGLVGVSGSGKTLTALSILRLLPPGGRILAGAVCLDGNDLLELDERQMRGVRGRQVGVVFQDPLSALNPVLTVGQQLHLALRAHVRVPRAAARARARELLTSVGLPDPETVARQHPHRLSGGMRQRALIALALAGRPLLLLADEPTTALDVTVQAEVMQLLRRLRGEAGLAMLLVSHDLALVAQNAERIAVMHEGRVVEEGPAGDIVRRPAHPQTRALLAGVPPLPPLDTRP